MASKMWTLPPRFKCG
ncbi:MAG: hypothetical protein F2889_01435 [Actinobacteria bacterium]|nr:hypothetical protein [Actinomycetota bacterium]